MNNFISIKWSRFLAEGEAEQFPWLEEIKSMDPEWVLDWIANSDRFVQVGSGAYRRVFVPIEDQNYVIKVAADRGAEQMNKDDFDTAKRYPLIFPKAYAHSDDFSWIVAEYTRPITWPSQMQKVLDQSFPKEQEALLKVADKLKFNPADPFHIMKMIMASFREDRPINEVASAAVAAARAELSQKTLAPEARGWFAGKMAMGPAYQELSKAMHEFEIDKLEIDKGNIGFDEDYNFKIIDSSVFDSDPEKESLNEEAENEPDLIKFSEELNDRISSLLFSPSSIEHLSQQTGGGEITTVLDTGELFADYETLNEVHLGITINDQAQGDVKAFYLCIPEDRSQSNLVIVLNIPRGYDKIEEFQEWLTEELEDALSHELQHSCDPTEMLTDDIPEGEEKWESLENIYKHFASDAETRGHLAGAKGRVRRSGADINEIVTGKVNLIFEEALEHDYAEEELMPVMQAIWEKWNNYLAGWNKSAETPLVEEGKIADLVQKHKADVIDGLKILANEIKQGSILGELILKSFEKELSRKEKTFMKQQITNILAGTVLLGIIALPGTPINLPLVVKLAKKFNIKLAPTVPPPGYGAPATLGKRKVLLPSLSRRTTLGGQRGGSLVRGKSD